MTTWQDTSNSYCVSKEKGLVLSFVIFCVWWPPSGMGSLVFWLLQYISCICKWKQKGWRLIFAELLQGDSCWEGADISSSCFGNFPASPSASQHPRLVSSKSRRPTSTFHPQSFHRYFPCQWKCLIFIFIFGWLFFLLLFMVVFFMIFVCVIGQTPSIVLSLLKSLSLSQYWQSTPRASAILDLWGFS